MAKIDSAEENQFVAANRVVSGVNHWIGLFRPAGYGTSYVWKPSNEAPTYTTWTYGEPTSSSYDLGGGYFRVGGDDDDEDEGGGDISSWNAKYATNQYYSICECTIP